MSDDLLITPGSRKLEIKDTSGNIDAKIETDASGNLLITNAGGDISIGDTSSDVFIGDGTNNVDIVFEQNGEIRGTSGVTLTLGAAGSSVAMATDLSLGGNDLTNVNDITISGNLTVNGTTTTLDSTNTVIEDSIIELNSGLTGANSKDIGFIFERGTTGNNAGFVWDESADRFTVFTTTDTAASDTVDTSSVANFQAGSFFGNGANLTSLNASNISSGTISDARLPGTISSNITGTAAGLSGTPNITVGTISSGTIDAGNVQITSTGSIELFRANGAFIDFKDSGSDDFDSRIMGGNSLVFSAGGAGSTVTALTLASGGATFGGTISSGAITTSGFFHITGSHTVYAGMVATSSTSNNSYNVIRFQQGSGSGAPTGLIGTAGSAVGNTAFRSGMNIGTQDSGSLNFIINDGYAGKFDTSGNLLIGTTSTTPAFGTGNGHAFHVGDMSHISRSGGTGLAINRASSDGDILSFRKDGTQIGIIGVDSTDNLYIAGSTGSTKGIYFNDAGVIPATTGGGVVDNAVDLGQSGYRFKNLYLSSRTIIGDGSNSAPAYTFGSDADTGMYRVSTNALAFATGGTERWRITSSGTLQGSGTISSGAITTSGQISISKANPVLILNDTTASSNADQVAYISFQDNGTEEAWVGWGSSGNTNFTINNNIGNITLNGSTSINGTLTMGGNTITGSNFNISGVNALTINDPGEGIIFTGTNNVVLYAVDDANDNIMKFDGAAKLLVDNDRVLASSERDLATNSTGTTSTDFVTVYNVNGNNLASHVRLSVTGTTGNVVVSCVADIIVNHSQDIFISSMSGNYTQLDIKVTSNDNEDFAIECKRTDSQTTQATLRYSLVALSQDTTISQPSSHSYTGATLTHRTKPGSYQSATSDAAHGYFPSLRVENYIYHDGDTDTSIKFDTNRVRIFDGGGTYLDTNNGSAVLHTGTTFGGDVSGTYGAIVVLDDSHNHIISNVDGLQTALDAKLAKSGGTMTGTITSRDVLVQSGYHLQRSNHHTGHLEGSYNNVAANAEKTNPIYSIGSSYNPNEDTLGNFYGIGYSKNTASFMTGALDAGDNNGWGLYVAADGDARIFLNASDGIINSTGEHYVNSQRVFHDGYHPNADKWTTARTLSLTGAVTGSVSWDGSGNASIATTATADPTLTLSGDASGSATFTNLGNATLSVTIANDSHTHAFNNLTGKTSGTGEYSTSGYLRAGRGSGGVALTHNDGYGNANVTFNHVSGVPEQAGNCGRIVVNTDSTTAAKMYFELLSNSGTTAVNTPSAMELTESGMYIPNYLYHMGDTDTYLKFDTNRIRLYAGGAVKLDTNNTYLTSTGNTTGTAGGLSGTPNITVGTIGSGNIEVGASDSANGTITIHGGGTGNAEGGELRLQTAADYDSTYDFYRLDVINDDFRIGRQGQTDFYIFQDGSVKAETDFQASNNITVGTGSNSPNLIINKATTGTGSILFRNGGNNKGKIFLDSNEDLQFYINNTTQALSIYESTSTVTSHLQLVAAIAGNTAKGSISMGPQTSGATKWSYLTGAHYNQTTGSGNGSGSAGIAIIGSLGTATENRVVIGGSIYESNPATRIEFWTHTANTHTTGGSKKITITGTGNLQFNSQTSTFDGVGMTYHTNNHLYVRGGPSGLILSDDGGQNTIQISDASDYVRVETGDGTERVRINSSGLDIKSGGLLIGGTERINSSRKLVGEDNRAVLNGSDTGALFGNTPQGGTGSGSAFVRFVQQNFTGIPGSVKWYISPANTDPAESDTYLKFLMEHDGDFHADGDLIGFSTSTGSDRKLKENIRDLEGSLDKTLKLRGVKYDWKDENKANDQLGFIAQEVEEVLPEVVKEVKTLTNEGETHLTVNYPAVVPLLVEAIKEQQTIINRLEERLNNLENKGEK